MSYAGSYSIQDRSVSIQPSAILKSSRSTKTPKQPPLERQSDDSNFPIVVHSHLGWDWVWQRPQQFLSRLSKKHPVLFVETLAPAPDLVSVCARLRTAAQFPAVTILQVQLPSWRWTDGDFVDQERRRVVQEALHGPLAGQFECPVQWFYDPMAVRSFAGHLNERATVYDCMDELAQFRFAPPEIREREIELLNKADVVFTGGRKLYEAKRRHHPNCHFYGCGVDVAHFGRARLDETPCHTALRGLAKPVLGYFGVIDERLDYPLIAQLADSNPAWSIVMVGPVVKVDQDLLPRRPNIHWIGRREYAELPSCAKVFDVCLMPFALNEATEFINPTKSLEYMATGRPIVSTAVPDVVANFESVVTIGRNHGEFLQFCRQAIELPQTAAIARGLQMAASNSWDTIVGHLEEHIQKVLQTRQEQSNPKGRTHGRV